MIPGRPGHHAPLLSGGVQHQELRERAPVLEGAGVLERFSLQEDPGAGALIELGAGEERRLADVGGNTLSGRRSIVRGGKGGICGLGR